MCYMSKTIITKAVVLSSADYKDFDKSVKLFAADGTILSATMRGVKKPKARLKSMAQVFAFGEYTLTKNGNYYTVTGGNLIDGMFGVLKSAEGFTAGAAMAEIVLAFSAGEPSTELFLLYINALRELCYSDTAPYLVGAHFAVRAMAMMGYAGFYRGSRYFTFLSELEKTGVLPKAAGETDSDFAKEFLSAVRYLERVLEVRIKSAELFIIAQKN